NPRTRVSETTPSKVSRPHPDASGEVGVPSCANAEEAVVAHLPARRCCVSWCPQGPHPGGDPIIGAFAELWLLPVETKTKECRPDVLHQPHISPLYTTPTSPPFLELAIFLYPCRKLCCIAIPPSGSPPRGVRLGRAKALPLNGTS